MITTEVKGVISYLCGNFYHEVSIYRDDELIDKVKVHCCEDNEEASNYAISISKALTKQEKQSWGF